MNKTKEHASRPFSTDLVVFRVTEERLSFRGLLTETVQLLGLRHKYSVFCEQTIIVSRPPTPVFSNDLDGKRTEVKPGDISGGGK